MRTWIKTGAELSLTCTSEGQALLEFAFASVLATAIVMSAIAVLKAAWNQTRCAYLVFETTHAELVGRRPPETRLRIQIKKQNGKVIGEARCGGIQERVTLSALEEDYQAEVPSWGRKE